MIAKDDNDVYKAVGNDLACKWFSSNNGRQWSIQDSRKYNIQYFSVSAKEDGVPKTARDIEDFAVIAEEDSNVVCHDCGRWSHSRHWRGDK